MSIFYKNNKKQESDYNFADELMSLIEMAKFKGNEGHNKMHLVGCKCDSCRKIWESHVKGVNK